jgi:hypothetical protein
MKENIKRARAETTVKESDVSTLSRISSSRDALSELGEDVIIKNKPDPPKLIDAMMQVWLCGFTFVFYVSYLSTAAVLLNESFVFGLSV